VPLDLVQADFNGDGQLDLVVAMGDSDLVSVHLNDGDGGLDPLNLGGTSFRNPNDVEIGDMNHDGRPNLVVANLDT